MTSVPPSTTSVTLISAAASGDRSSMEKVCKIYHPLVYSWIRKMGFQEADAAEITQEVFQDLCSKINKYDAEKGSFRRWLWRVTQNKVRSILRKKKFVEVTSFDLDNMPTPESATSEAPPASVLLTAAKEFLDELEPHDLEILMAMKVSKIPAAEIAAEFGLTVSNVYTRVHRICKKLIQLVGEIEADVSSEDDVGPEENPDSEEDM